MKIFVLLSRFPYPLEKGDKLRAYYQIASLAKGNEIHLFALSDVKVEPLHLDAVKPFCKSIRVFRITWISKLWNIFRALFSGKPLQAGYFYNSCAQKQINRAINAIRPDHIYCQLIRVAAYVEDQPVPKTLDYQDVFSKGVARRLEHAPWYLRPVLKMEYRRLLRWEHRMFDRFDHKTIISKPDRELIPHPDRDTIAVIENGVNTDYFKPLEVKKEFDIVFTGNMGYPPNIDAACFLAESVMPLVRKSHPDATLVIAGATPHAKVKALETDKVIITGWVEDIREYYARARLFIAPMRLGTGLQNKLLEAMAMKIPCITTSLANNALEALPGSEILLADTAQGLADQIVFLLQNQAEAEKIATLGFHFVHRRYNWDKATERLLTLMQSTPE